MHVPTRLESYPGAYQQKHPSGQSLSSSKITLLVARRGPSYLLLLWDLRDREGKYHGMGTVR